MKSFKTSASSKLFFLLISISAILISSGCGTSLSREKAKSILSEAIGLPISEQRLFKSGFDYSLDDNWQGQMNKYYPGEASLVDKGYRKVFVTSRPLAFGWKQYYVHYRFTDKTNSFILNSSQNGDTLLTKIKVSSLDNIEIIGQRKITDSEYEVEFNLRRTITDFAEAYNNKTYGYKQNVNSPIDTSPSITLKAKIVKYDDGWKISNDEKESLLKRINP